MRFFKTISHYYTPQYAVWILAAIIVAGLVSYVYFVQQAVVNVAERNSAENKVAELQSDIGEMEFRYISLKKDVDLAYARSQGFEESSEARYVTRGSGRTLTLRDAR